MGVELQNPSESLLGHHGKIVGIVQEHPCHRAGHRTHTTHELRQTLTDGGYSAIVGRTEAECHGCLMDGAHTLRRKMFGDPGIG
jgi:hypothetical protein